jgi:hypothetical protein
MPYSSKTAETGGKSATGMDTELCRFEVQAHHKEETRQMMCCTISDMMKLKQDYPETSFAVQEIGPSPASRFYPSKTSKANPSPKRGISHDTH